MFRWLKKINFSKLVEDVSTILQLAKTILYEVQDIKDTLAEQKGVIEEQGKAIDELSNLANK